MTFLFKFAAVDDWFSGRPPIPAASCRRNGIRLLVEPMSFEPWAGALVCSPAPRSLPIALESFAYLPLLRQVREGCALWNRFCPTTSIYPVGRKLRPSHLIGPNRRLSRRKSIYLAIAGLPSPSLWPPRSLSFGLGLRHRMPVRGFLFSCRSCRSAPHSAPALSSTQDRLAGLISRSLALQPIHLSLR